MKITNGSKSNTRQSTIRYYNPLFLTLLLMLLTHSNINAEGLEVKKGTISGNITDSGTNVPLQYVQVAIYNQSDSMLVDGTITNEQGNFIIDKIPFGQYYLVAEYIGYKNEVHHDITIDGEENVIELENIQLAEKTTEIDEVNVVAQKNNMMIKADKKVLNVEKNLSATGGTAIDALKISPSVTVDQDGNVLLRGSSNFRVLVDGKPTALKPNEALKQIPAGRIDNIEIITNPSAKYEAAGTAGIINIITKKGMGVGTSGIINATAGTGDKYNADMSLNYTNDKLNITLGTTWKDNVQFYNMDELLQTTQDGNKRTNDILFYRQQTDRNLGGNVTIDYDFNVKNNITYSAEAGYTHFYVDANFKYDETVENQPGHSYVYEDLHVAILADYFTNNLSFTHKFDENSVWTNSVFYSKINYLLDDEQTRYYTEQDFNIDGITPYYMMQYQNDNFSTEVRAKTDYTKTNDNGSVFETGGQFHQYHRYLDLNAETFNFDSNTWEPDPVFTNEFDFNEQIYSAYANYSGTKNKINYNLGLRLEYTNRLIESFTLNEQYEYKKLNYFPTLSLTRAFGETKQLSFNYSRRIDRPDEFFLNPFPDVSNEFQKAYGNPLLRPNLTDSYELSFQKHFAKGMFSSQAYLRNTNDAFTQVISSDDDGIMNLTFDNISDDKEFGVENMVNIQACKWWSLNASLNIKGQSSKGTMNDEAFDRSAFTFDTRLINSFVVGKNTSAQLMAFYFHDQLGNAIGDVSRFYWVDVSVQQNLFNQRLALTLQAKDIFNTNQLKFNVDGSDYRFYVHRKPEYPIVMFSLSYKFNNYKNNSKKVKTKLKMG